MVKDQAVEAPAGPRASIGPPRRLWPLEDAPMTGGGSDANFTSAMGVPTLDGLGADGDSAHTLHEHPGLHAGLSSWRHLLAHLA